VIIEIVVGSYIIYRRDTCILHTLGICSPWKSEIFTGRVQRPHPDSTCTWSQIDAWVRLHLIYYTDILISLRIIGISKQMVWRSQNPASFKKTLQLSSLKLTVCTWKLMVGRLLSLWGPAYFQGRAVSFRECKLPGNHGQQRSNWTRNLCRWAHVPLSNRLTEVEPKEIGNW